MSVDWTADIRETSRRNGPASIDQQSRVGPERDGRPAVTDQRGPCVKSWKAVSNVARGWGQQPTAALTGTFRSGVSAALWIGQHDQWHPVEATANAHIHSIGIARTRFRTSTSVDDHPVFAGEVGPGCCSIIRAGERPRGLLAGSWAMLHLYVPTALLGDYVETEGLATRAATLELINPSWAFDRVIERLSQAFVSEMDGGQPLSRLRIDALSLDVAVHLVRTWSNLSGARPVSACSCRGLAPYQLKRVHAVIEADLAGEVSLGELAAAVGLSPAHFSRAFKASTGLSPFQWLLRRRLDRAKDLLAHTTMALADIGLAVGFVNQAQFTTTFRKHVGLPPGGWRRQRCG